MQEHPELLRLVLERDGFLLELHPTKVLDNHLVQRVASATATQLGASAARSDTAHLELVRGGLLYALDALETAHSIFQENPSHLGSYWHGMLHRREGDFDNARYWFRRAGTPPCFHEESPMGKRWDPSQLTHLFEERPTGKALEDARQLQRAEFEALLTHCLQMTRNS